MGQERVVDQELNLLDLQKLPKDNEEVEKRAESFKSQFSNLWNLGLDEWGDGRFLWRWEGNGNFQTYYLDENEHGIKWKTVSTTRSKMGLPKKLTSYSVTISIRGQTCSGFDAQERLRCSMVFINSKYPILTGHLY